LRKLNKFVNSIEKPKRILIAGLPEKYGLSMDFFLLGQMLKAEIVVIDERSDALERAEEVLRILRSKNIIEDINTVFLKADRIAEFNNESFYNEEFDLALSSEVLQRLGDARETYISALQKAAHNFAVFVPNRGNESHAALSGLNSVYLRDLLGYVNSGDSEKNIFDYGYIDMPPFPPGMTRSQEKRNQASESRLEAVLMKGLEIYSFCEDIIPEIVKKKIAHIVYVMQKKHDGTKK
jgi:hypothetical protein